MRKLLFIITLSSFTLLQNSQSQAFENNRFVLANTNQEEISPENIEPIKAELDLKQKTKSDNPYEILNMTIQGYEDNATEARKLAIKDGQRLAFKETLKNIKIEEGYHRFFTDEEIEKCVQSRQFSNERLSKKSYYANMEVVFNKDFVQYYLKLMKINQDSPKSKVFLAIPVYQDEFNSYIWEEQNIWMQNWNDIVTRKDVRKIKLSSGDDEDMSKITSTLVNSNSFSNFKSLADKYNTDSIIITHSKYNMETNALDVTLKFLEPDAIETQELELQNTQNLPEEELIKIGTHKVINYLLQDYEGQQKNTLAQEKIMSCTIPFSKPRHWAVMRYIIKELNDVEKLEITKLQRKSVDIKITYKDSVEDLMKELKEAGIHTKYKNGQYYLYSKRTFNLMR